MFRKASPLSFAVLACLAASPALAADRADKAARAADKAACTDAYGKAQTLRDAHRLVSARDQLRICARPSCTSFIARDCTAWLVDIESRIASIVPLASDASGSGLNDVTVSMDGVVISHKLDGQSIEVDAGPHTFTFALPSGVTVDQSYVVVEGQKAQRVSVVMGPPKSLTATSATTPKTGEPFESPASDASSWTARKSLAVVVGGVGLAAIGMGSYFGLKAMSLASQFNNECPSTTQPCSTDLAQASSDRNNAIADGAISTAGFIAGGVLVAAGVVLFVTAPKPTDERPAQTSRAMLVTPSVLPGGGGLWLRGTF